MKHDTKTRGLIEIGYIEPIYIRKLGSPSPITVGPSSHGISVPYVTPRTILGAFVTSLIELGRLSYKEISDLGASMRDLKAYHVLKNKLGIRVLGPPYIVFRKANISNETPYIFTRSGPLSLNDLFDKIDENLESVGKNSDMNKVAKDVWKSLTALMEGLEEEQKWKHYLVRVSLQDPEKVAREGYLFSMIYLSLGKAINEKHGEYYIYLPIEISGGFEDWDRLKYPVLTRFGGNSRIAYISVRMLDGVDPLLRKLIERARSQHKYGLLLLLLASPFPAPDNLRRSEVAERFAKMIIKIISSINSETCESYVYAQTTYVDQYPEGWDLRKNVRRPYNVWILPGSSVLLRYCGTRLEALIEALYTGAYIEYIKGLEDLWGSRWNMISEAIDEGYGRFIMVSI